MRQCARMMKYDRNGYALTHPVRCGREVKSGSHLCGLHLSADRRALKHLAKTARAKTKKARRGAEKIEARNQSNVPAARAREVPRWPNPWKSLDGIAEPGLKLPIVHAGLGKSDPQSLVERLHTRHAHQKDSLLIAGACEMISLLSMQVAAMGANLCASERKVAELTHEARFRNTESAEQELKRLAALEKPAPGADELLRASVKILGVERADGIIQEMRSELSEVLTRAVYHTQAQKRASTAEKKV